MTARPMNVLLTGFSFTAVGGLEIVSAAVARMLADRGHRVQCAAIHGQGVVETEGYRVVGTAPSLRVARSIAHRVPAFYPLARLRALAAWADVIVAMHCHTLPQVFRALSGVRSRPPVVAWLHGREVWGRNGRDYAGVLEKTDGLVAVSRYTADTVTDLLGAGRRPEVIYNPVDVESFQPVSRGEAIERHSILTVGRLASHTEHKGYDMLIKALAMLRRRCPDLPLTLTIAGGGPRLPALEALAAEQGVSGRVRFSGLLSRAELARRYATCDLFALPSQVMAKGDECIGEGFGVVNIEAAACGRPVLTSTHGGCPETVLPGISGLLVDPTSVDAIADGIESIFRRDADQRDRMGARGRAFVEQTFSSRVIADRVGGLLEEFAARHSPKGAGTP